MNDLKGLSDDVIQRKLVYLNVKGNEIEKPFRNNWRFDLFTKTWVGVQSSNYFT